VGSALSSATGADEKVGIMEVLGTEVGAEDKVGIMEMLGAEVGTSEGVSLGGSDSSAYIADTVSSAAKSVALPNRLTKSPLLSFTVTSRVSSNVSSVKVSLVVTVVTWTSTNKGLGRFLSSNVSSFTLQPMAMYDSGRVLR